MIEKDILLDGTKLKGYELKLHNAVLVMINAPKGYLMCGYLNMAASDKFNECAAIVSGVNTVEEMLLKQVSVVSKSAVIAGITPGMTGRQALLMMLK